MKNSSDKGFNQHYNAQVAVEQESLLIVGTSLVCQRRTITPEDKAMGARGDCDVPFRLLLGSLVVFRR